MNPIEIIMDNHQRTQILMTFGRRLFMALLLKNAVTLAAVFLFLWGAMVLALRVNGLQDINVFVLSLLAFFAIPFFAWRNARRLVPDDWKLGAILDRDNHAGGLIMSSFEKNLDQWNEQIKTVNVPNIHWEPRRIIGLVLLSVIFAAVSLLLPMSVVSGPIRNRLNVDDQIRRLTNQLETLEREKILSVEEVETRKLDLKQIQKEADGMGPVKTFDALDHVENRMNQQAAEAVENAQKTNEILAKAEALSHQVKEISSELDESTAKSLMEGLANSLDEMLSQNEKLTQNIKENLSKNSNEKENKNSSDEQKDANAEALKKQWEENHLKGLTPEMLEQLCDAMKQCQGNCERMCGNLQNAGFPIDKEMLKKLAEAKKVEREDAERMLSDLWAECDGCKGECPGNCRGQSKISPRYTKKQDWTTDPNAPPGDVQFAKDPDEEGAEFKAKVLPPATLEAFLNSQKIGASVSAPESNPQEVSNDPGGSIADTGNGTANAHKHTIYPQHRGTIERFFNR
jgi:hypothetical protein